MAFLAATENRISNEYNAEKTGMTSAPFAKFPAYLFLLGKDGSTPPMHRECGLMRSCGKQRKFANFVRIAGTSYIKIWLPLNLIKNWPSCLGWIKAYAVRHLIGHTVG